MKRFISVIPLIIVALIAIVIFIPQQQYLYTNNMQILFLDVKDHNNIIALALIEEAAESDPSVYNQIGITEADFQALKIKACQNHLKQVRSTLDTHEDDEYYFKEICGSYTEV